MLRRLKAQVSQVANDLPGVLSPGAGRDSRDGTPFFPNSDTNQNEVDDEIEGFLCPICMTTFNSPELLSGHFEEAHNKENSLIPNPNFENSIPLHSPGTNSTASFPSKDKEIEELRIQVNEEHIYAEKLKSVVAQATDVPQGEVPYLMQQIQVLEAGKSMVRSFIGRAEDSDHKHPYAISFGYCGISVTQRMLEFEKENGQLKRFAENGQQERAEIMAKLKQLSAQIRTLTDENESNKVEKEVLKKEVAVFRFDNEKLEKEIDVLNKALNQRPSEDDVAVLRTELVHAQKLMDEISQHKDVEISEHLNSIRLLNMEREKSSELVRSLTSELEDTRQILLTCQKDLEDAKSDSSQKGKRIEELHGKVEANLAELASCREKIAQLEETVRVSAREIDDSHAMNESNLKKLTQLSDKLEQVIEEKKRYETEMSNFEEKNDLQSNSIRSNSIITSKDQELFSLREDLVRAQTELEKLMSQCETRAAESETLAKQLLTLQENSRELVNKISQGEDGSKMAIEQLKEENRKLQEEINQLTTSFKEEKEGLVVKVTELEKQHREEKKVVEEKLKKIEHQKETLERRLREAEDDVNRKAERFVEMEKEIEDDRRLASERIQKLKDIILAKDANVSEARKQIEELSSQLSDRNRLLREKEHQIEESRRKIEESVNHLAEAEAKARKLEAELSQSEARRLAVTDSESDLRSQLDDKEALILSFKQQVEKLTAELASKEQALRDAVTEA
ncbi:unnamed protein product, partial [Haemonchus placei]|uniref:C2H2-type domain-containing protein n=1 Tax=Haemonchus placei TaxID=6290 RepID=A0A0N4X9D0_HAEPC